MRPGLRWIAVAVCAIALLQPWAGEAVGQQRSDQATRGVVVAPSGFERVGSGPNGIFWVRDGLTGIVDALANSVAFVDDAGRVVGRAVLPAGFIVSGTQANATRILLL